MINFLFGILFSFVLLINAQVERDPLFDEVEVYLDQLKSSQADVLCPDEYAHAGECYSHAKEMSNTGESFRDIREELENCVYFITTINEKIDNRTQIFSDVLNARKAALELNAYKHAASDWISGEEVLRDAVDYAADGDMEYVRELIPESINYYNQAAQKAVRANQLLYDWSPLKNANAELANLLSPGIYAEGMDYLNMALDNLNADGDEEDREEYLKEASMAFDQSTVIAGEFANRYPGILDERIAAKEAGAENYAQKFWLNAEKNLAFLASVYEDGDYDYVLEERPAAEDMYTFAKLEAVKNKILGPAKQKIDKAYEVGAGDLSPITLGESESLYNDGILLVDSDNYTEDEVQSIADESNAYANLAIRITEIIQNADEDNPTWEKQILAWNTLDLIRPSRNPATVPVSDMEGDEGESNHSEYFDEVSDLFTDGEAEIKEAGGMIVISLTGLNFGATQVTLNNENMYLVDKAIAAMQMFPNSDVKIIGHTDNSGTKLYNKILSEKRAQEVMTYIINNSTIAPRRITIEGHGEDEPIADNTTFEGRVRNRRVDVVIDYL